MIDYHNFEHYLYQAILNSALEINKSIEPDSLFGYSICCR